MIQILDQIQNPEWDTLIHKLYGYEVHKNRKQETILSRQALLETLQELGCEVQIQDLVLVDHSQITKLPEYTISLSHTKNCGAALVADKKTFKSVGIDIEPLERIVQPNVLQRVGHPRDLKLASIEIWCLKEAAFKALMNSGNFEKPLEFSSIQISDNKWTHSPSGLEGEWELGTSQGFVIAQAFLKN